MLLRQTGADKQGTHGQHNIILRHLMQTATLIGLIRTVCHCLYYSVRISQTWCLSQNLLKVFHQSRSTVHRSVK